MSKIIVPLGGGFDLYCKINEQVKKELGENHDPFGLTFKNPVLFQHYRANELIDEDIVFNGITTGGKTSVLDTAFRQQAVLTWKFGLIDNSGFTAINDSTDVMSGHAGWSEFISYSQVNRPLWGPTAAAAASITNASAVTFSITGSGTLWGMFVTSDNTINGSTGILWSTAGFSVTKPVLNGDSVKLTYTLNC